MELRDLAVRILSADTIEDKLHFPEVLTDHHPGEPLFWDTPSRPKEMGFQKHSRKDKLPKPHELIHQDKRAICMHRFAGHELLAVEIMAYALLAFPNSPKHFRRGIANTLREEQEHVKLYMQQMKRLQIHFCDLPMHKHFWAYTPYLKTPEEYISVMSLTFEMANLDYAPMYGAAFEKAGDQESVNLMKRILADEIMHVSFGWNWLKKLKACGETQWSAWLKNLPSQIPIQRAMGREFQIDNRLQAGVSKQWIEQYQSSLLTSNR